MNLKTLLTKYNKDPTMYTHVPAFTFYFYMFTTAALLT